MPWPPVLAHYGQSLAFGVALDGVRNVGEPPAGPRSVNAPREAVEGAIDEVLCLRADCANRNGKRLRRHSNYRDRAPTSMLDDVALLQWSFVGGNPCTIAAFTEAQIE